MMITDRSQGLPVRILATALLVAGLVAALAAGSAQAALKHYDGKVLGTNSGAKTFRIKTENGRKPKFEVNRRTEFERIAGGFAGLDRGMKVEVDAKRTAHGLVARQVEPEGDDDRGDDADDPPGDDHGDDGPNHD
jgi:hypothetical protein